MKDRLVQLLRLIRGIIVTAVILLIIGSAVIVGAGRLLVPHIDHLRPQVEDYLARRTGQVVSITRMEATWNGVLPVFLLHDLHIGSTAADDVQVSIARVQLEIDALDLFSGSRSATWLAIEGLQITLAQHADGAWAIGMDNPVADQPARINPGQISLGNLRLRNSQLRIEPLTHAAQTFSIPEVRVHSGAGSLALAGRIEPSGGSRQFIELRLIAEGEVDAYNHIRAWLSGNDLALADWFPQVTGYVPDHIQSILSDVRFGFESWMEWTQGQVTRLHGDLSLEPGLADDRLPIHTAYVLEHAAEGVQLDIAPRGGTALAAAFDDLQVATDGRRWAMSTRSIELAHLQAMLRPWLPQSDWIPAHIAGHISQLYLAGDRAGNLTAASGRIHNLTTAPVRRIPGVTGLDLDIGLDGDLLAVTLGGERPIIDWSGMLRQPVELATLSGRVLLARDFLIMDEVAITHNIAQARADGLIAWADHVPFLDFQIHVPQVTPDDPRPYLPAGIIPNGVMRWLDHALTGGEHASGYLQFFGNPRQWPWDSGVGEFLAHVKIQDARLGIYPGWPTAESLRGTVLFQGRGLSGHTDHGRIAGMAIKQARIHIEDLKNDPVLNLQLDAPALDAPALLAFLETLPTAIESDAENLRYGGEIDLGLSIRLPLRSGNLQHWSMSGTAATRPLNIAHSEGLFVLDEIIGDLNFERDRIGPALLHGRLNGGAVTIAIDGTPGEHTRLTLHGLLSPQQLIPPAWQVDRWQALPASGRSAWIIELDRYTHTGTLRASSDLVGTRLELPAPLQKPEDIAWPAKLELPVKPAIDRFSFTLGEGLALAALRDDATWRWGLGLGGQRAPIGDNTQFIVRGELNRLDLGGWLRTAGNLGATPEIGDADGRVLLEIGELLIGTRSISDVTLNLRRADPYWLLDVVGTGANGQLRLPATANAARVAVGDFQRLHLSTPADRNTGEENDPQAPPAIVLYDPRNLPDLHLLVEDFRLGDLHAGRARVEAHGTADGLEVEALQVGHDSLRLSGRGRWRMLNQHPTSEFDLSLHFLGARQLLRAAGFESTMNAHSGELSLRAVWPGSPMDFDLRRLSGSLLMDLRDGVLPEARPGLGRILSLISLSALPRRLQLDFRDVVGTGFSFDSLKGHFTLARGRAETADLTLKSPAADIRITGIADLVERQYDQQIVIRPGLGATLPVIGAIAAGPGGAAAGLALQGLLGGSLRDMGEMRYRVSGPWDDPVVEVETGAD